MIHSKAECGVSMEQLAGVLCVIPQQFGSSYLFHMHPPLVSAATDFYRPRFIGF